MGERPPHRGDAVADGRRKDVQVERKDLDQDEAEKERRHRVEDEVQRGDGVVTDRVALDRLGDAERNGDDQRQDQGGQGQVGAAPGVLLEERADALVELVGVAEVEADELAEIAEELRDLRPVIAMLKVPGHDSLRLRPGPQHRVHRARLQPVQQHEGEDRDPGDDDDRHKEPPDDVSGHPGGSLWSHISIEDGQSYACRRCCGRQRRARAIWSGTSTAGTTAAGSSRSNRQADLRRACC